MAGLAFEHLAVNVSDPAAVAAWYVDHLGMTIVRRGDPPVSMHFLADAGRRAMIELYSNASAPTDIYRDLHPAQLHLAFTSADPDADTDRLVAAGATLIEHLHNPDGSHLTMLRDPWGLPIQLAKRATPML
ncbi:MAG: VOC family protein [Acidobacteria bacterium]|nr:VOC family protein [Acidobacteriota bacterium]